MPRTALILTIAIAGLITPSAAMAVPLGALTQPGGAAGCIKYDGANGCATDALLDSPDEVAVSPDGKNVYAVSIFDGAVVGYSRDPVSGTLGSRVSCATVAGGGGCQALGAKMNYGYGLDVSPDGKNVYAVGYLSQTILVFSRDASTGALTYVNNSCHSSGVVSGCTNDGTGHLNGVDGVDVSPDGKSVYTVASQVDQTLVRYDRDPDGTLHFAYCFNYAGSNGCDAAPALTGPDDVEVSPDNKNVYVASNGLGVASFSRDAAGAISPLPGTSACIGSGAPCSSGHDFGGLNKISISPDGNNIYGAATASNALDVVSRAPDGSLSQAAGAAGAVPLPVAGSVVVSPDGKSVYAGSGYYPLGGDSVTAFDRAANGSIAQMVAPYGCFNEPGSGSCTVGRALDDVISLAMPPQGNSLYTGVYSSGAVGTFVREVPPVCTDSPLQTLPNIEVTDVPLNCSDPNGDPTTLAISTAPAHGTAQIDQGTRRVRFTPTSRYHGADNFKFTASDGSLTSDPATAQISLSDKLGPLIEFGSQKFLRLSKTGSTKVSLKCPASEVDGCPNGQLTIGSSARINFTLKKKRKAKLTLGRAKFTLAAGEKKDVRVKLGKTARRVVRRLHNVRVNLTATSKDPGANTGKATKATRIKARR